MKEPKSTQRDLQSRRLYEQAQEGSLIMDFDDGKILDISQEWLSILGYNQEEGRQFIGQALWEISPMIDKNAIVHAYAKVKVEGTVKYECLLMMRLDGSIIHVKFSCNAYWLNTHQVIQCNIQDISDKKENERKMQLYKASMIKSLSETISALVKMTFATNIRNYQHQLRVSNLAAAISKEMQLPPNEAEGIIMAGLIYDIGLTPGSISHPENPTEDMKFQSHISRGVAIVEHIHFMWPIIEIITQHHERLDGSGYPNHLKNGEIILGARVLAVADVLDDLIIDQAKSTKEALKFIEHNRGKLFDEKVVDACLTLYRKKSYAFPEIPDTPMEYLNFNISS